VFTILFTIVGLFFLSLADRQPFRLLRCDPTMFNPSGRVASCP